MFEAITRSRLDILIASAVCAAVLIHWAASSFGFSGPAILKTVAACALVMAAACATNAFYRRTG